MRAEGATDIADHLGILSRATRGPRELFLLTPYSSQPLGLKIHVAASRLQFCLIIVKMVICG